jgi:hypothetical protein
MLGVDGGGVETWVEFVSRGGLGNWIGKSIYEKFYGVGGKESVGEGPGSWVWGLVRGMKRGEKEGGRGDEEDRLGGGAGGGIEGGAGSGNAVVGFEDSAHPTGKEKVPYSRETCIWELVCVC